MNINEKLKFNNSKNNFSNEDNFNKNMNVSDDIVIIDEQKIEGYMNQETD